MSKRKMGKEGTNYASKLYSRGYICSFDDSFELRDPVCGGVVNKRLSSNQSSAELRRLADESKRTQ